MRIIKLRLITTNAQSHTLLCRLSLPLLALLWILVASLASCNKETFYATGNDVAIDFSCDTLAFDTVFTAMGSTTQMVKVYNHSGDIVRFNSIALQKGRSSRFRLNVDGDTSMVVRNLELADNDSIFIFVQVNINPDDQNSPFIVEDHIIFNYDGGEKQLPLSAYGRNAIYHIPDHTLQNSDGSIPTDAFGNPYNYSIIDCDNWRHDRPHVIVGYAVVDSRSTLNLQAGDELYFYNDAVLWVYDSASLKVQGSAEQPVLFTSVRHDGWYDFLPGQWGYIWLSSGSHGNTINHALIENGYVGILADTNVDNQPTLRISNSIIRSASYAGLIAQTAYIEADNLLVHTCGTVDIALQYGGRYSFRNCTLANYWNYSSRKGPCAIFNNRYTYENNIYLYPFTANFTDCIIYGSMSDGELTLDLDETASPVVQLNHCLIRGGEWDEDPLFSDPDNGDFSLQENSPATGIGWQK